MDADTSRRVFVVVGVYQPDRQLFRRQLVSLSDQTHSNIVVLVAPDGPLDADASAAVSELNDPRFLLLDQAERVGVHANFARGLNAALSRSDRDSDLFAYCDQDDVWRADKIERQVACLADPTISLCHSDARVVSREGRVTTPSLFEHESRPRQVTLADLLIANSVTGMTATFRRDVAQAASAFPMKRCRHILHDHWTTLVAALFGTIRMIDEPLVDYVQHGESVMGARPGPGMFSMRGAVGGGAAYRRKCYRQFLWHHHAYRLLQEGFGDRPDARKRLSVWPLRALYDCRTSAYAGVALSAAYRLRGRWREADQVWRLGRAKPAYCARALRRAGARREPGTPGR